MHIDRRLAAAGHAMQQGDGVTAHGMVDFFVRPLLFLAQRWRFFQNAAQVGKAVDFFPINFKYAPLYCFMQYSATHTGAF